MSFFKKNNNKCNNNILKHSNPDFDKIIYKLKLDFNKNLISLNDPYSINITKYFHYDKMCILCGTKKKLLECLFCINNFCSKHILQKKNNEKICRRCKTNNLKKVIDKIFWKFFFIIDTLIEKNKENYNDLKKKIWIY